MLKDNSSLSQKVEKLLRREEALSAFGTFAFREPVLQLILDEAARVCAESLEVTFSKICRYRSNTSDLVVVAGQGWRPGVVGQATSVADETSPQGRAFITGRPQICGNIDEANNYALPLFYPAHGILSTVDVIVAAKTGLPFGVLEVDSQATDAFDAHDVTFLTGFANILAEAVATASRAEDLRQGIVWMKQLVEEKETLSQELKHRVRNSLHLVYGLLTAEVSGDHDEGSVVAFRSIALRVMGLAEVFDHLPGIGMSNIINLGDYVSAVCRNLPQLYAEATAVRLACVTEPVRVHLDDATALGIIVTELVNNAYLHAFPDHVGEISVALQVIADRPTLSISDNGIGYVEANTKRHGMRLVRRLVEQVGGTLSLELGSGSTWIIRLPIDEISHPLATH